MQWTQWNSDIWWWGHCSLVQKGQTSGCSEIVVYGGGDIVFCAKRSNQRMQWMQYAVD